LLAIDLDGTLLDDSRKIDPTTAEKLAAVCEKGVELVLCSGRRFSTAMKYATELGLSELIVVNNGTIVKEVPSGRTVRSDYFPRREMKEVLTLLKEMELPAVLLMDNYPECDFYVDVAEDGNEYHAEYLTMNKGSGRVVEDLVRVECERPVQVVVFHAYPTLVEAEKKIREAMNGRVSVLVVRNVRYKGCSLEISAPTASKWKALKWIAEQRGIKTEEIVAIGDDSNDVEMVKEAGFGVAVANALDEVKAVADFVTEHPWNRGIEEALGLLA
jgi:hypothetical protein